MGNDVLTLQEVADMLGKSTQTIRRMIKKGELRAQRIKTAQGFQYGIYREQVESVLPRHSPSSVSELEAETPRVTVEKAQPDEEKPVLTSQLDTGRSPLVTPADVEAFLGNDYFTVEPSPVRNPLADLQPLLEMQHREKMQLLHILEALQVELRREREKPKSLWAWFFGKS